MQYASSAVVTLMQTSPDICHKENAGQPFLQIVRVHLRVELRQFAQQLRRVNPVFDPLKQRCGTGSSVPFNTPPFIRMSSASSSCC